MLQIKVNVGRKRCGAEQGSEGKEYGREEEVSENCDCVRTGKVCTKLDDCVGERGFKINTKGKKQLMKARKADIIDSSHEIKGMN